MFLLGFLLIIAPSLNAESVYYPVNSTINYTVPCINNNTICTSAAMCNINILYANDSMLKVNQSMKSAGGLFSYLLYPNETSQVGLYKAYVFCYDGAVKGYSLSTFTLTGSGSQPANDNFSIIVYLMFLIAAGGMIYSLIMLLEKLSEWDVTAKDLMVALGFVFLMYMSIYLSTQYIVSQIIPQWGMLLINMLSYGIVIGGFIGFIISAIVRHLTQKKKREEEDD